MLYRVTIMEWSAALVIITRVGIVHKCVIVTKKLHKVPHHMVKHFSILSICYLARI